MKTRVAMVGFGYWGPNIARNLENSEDTELAYICELDKDKRGRAEKLFPSSKAISDYDRVLDDKSVEGIVIVTNSKSHFPLAKKALERGKHVMLEKPITETSGQALELVKIAERKNLILMVGHTFLYNGGVRKLKEIIDSGNIGKWLYAYAIRVSLGPYRSDANVVWDLAPHDISVLLYLKGKKVMSVSVRANCSLKEGIPDVAFMVLKFEDDTIAHIHASWLDPLKVRKLTIIGSEKMVIFDDIEPLEKVKIFEKSATISYAPETFSEFQAAYNYGDILIPKIDVTEPLKMECQHFVDCIRSGSKPVSDGMNGLEVVRVLEAAQKSLESGGRDIEVSE
ncbi:MAG: Gfo/Idh/MocA family oxidoreductase [Candidatus Diapherotrites archaeon]|uniref:Gfo/Idh/MocA family oxidoreductase n=1 Tax=Candidatus Iainarchaeum sp. TaxID=3101447 RepID=A0A8T3YI49_9ARCH|nr:Gfo/Idh/MocA family oxidoreductase [Candidatus Diapherotrites archaeon]